MRGALRSGAVGIALAWAVLLSGCARCGGAPVAAVDAGAAPVAAVKPGPDVRLVRTHRAPVFTEAEDDAATLQQLEQGFAVWVARSLGERTWRGDALGTPRRGELLEARRSRDDGTVYVFAQDLGPRVEPPPLDALCAGADAGCLDVVRAVATGPGAWFGYVPCAAPGCLIAALTPGAPARQLQVDGLVAVALHSPTVALLETRWVREPTWTGASIAALRLPTLQPLGSLVFEERHIDGGVQAYRAGAWSVDGGALVVTGTDQSLEVANGAIHGQVPFTASLPLP